MTETRVSGGSCLCGAVRYEVRGPLRDVLYCHCNQCRKTSGHFVAATDAMVGDFVLLEDGGLRWYASSPEAERGFCTRCGSSLFWRPVEGDRIAIMAGTLDTPTGLRAREHIFLSSAGDYYSIDDGLPQHPTWNPN